MRKLAGVSLVFSSFYLAVLSIIIDHTWADEVGNNNNNHDAAAGNANSCLVEEGETIASPSLDVATTLQPLRYAMGGDSGIFSAYIEPHVSSFYRDPHLSLQPVEAAFKGRIGKFLNLGNESLKLFV